MFIVLKTNAIQDGIQDQSSYFTSTKVAKSTWTEVSQVSVSQKQIRSILIQKVIFLPEYLFIW